jgi:hypothetical protein
LDDQLADGGVIDPQRDFEFGNGLSAGAECAGARLECRLEGGGPGEKQPYAVEAERLVV